MSPDSIIVNINTFLYLLVCVGRHSGRLPVLYASWCSSSYGLDVGGPMILLSLWCCSGLCASAI